MLHVQPASKLEHLLFGLDFLTHMQSVQRCTLRGKVGLFMWTLLLVQAKFPCIHLTQSSTLVPCITDR